MKIVKLNRRYKMFTLQGFKIGLRFDHWEREAMAYEKAAKQVLGNTGWVWKYSTERIREDWCAGFGHKRSGEIYTPYWIYLRNEEPLSLIMLAVDQDYV